MAGRFLTLDDAAEKLGISADEVHRLVDRKKIYAIRDGGVLKFKADDLDQYLLEQQEEAGTSDDLIAQPEAPVAAEGTPPEVGTDGDDSLTLDVEAMLELEPGSAIEAEPASVVALEEPLSAIGLADDAAEQSSAATPAPFLQDQPEAVEPDSLVLLEADEATGSDVIVLANEASSESDAVSVIAALSAPNVDTSSEASGGEVLLADSGPLSLDRDDLELESIIAASTPSLPTADASLDEGTLSIDLGEPILGDPLASGGLESPSGSLIVGSDGDLAIGSNIPSGQVGSALSDVLDSGVLIEEKAVELEGIQTWDEVDLGIPEEELAGEELPEDQDAFASTDLDGDVTGGDLGGNFDGNDFTLGESGDSSLLGVSDDPSEASGFFPSGIEASGLSEGSFTGSAGLSGSLELPGDMVADVRFSTWQLCGLICCSLILLTGGIVAFDLVRTIGSPQGTALANPLLNALAETFGWR
jgi:excisionase family DNA binding protein